MPAGPYVRSNEILWESAGPFTFNTGRLTSINGTVKSAAIVMPCNGRIAAFVLAISTTFTNAAATVAFGTFADTESDTHLNDHSITNLTGFHDLIGSSLWLNRDVTKGTEMAVAFTNVDATGVGNVHFVISPGGNP